MSKCIVSVGNMSVQERTFHSSNQFMGSLKDWFWHLRDWLRNRLPSWAHLNTGMHILQILDFVQNIILHNKPNVINTNSDLLVNLSVSFIESVSHFELNMDGFIVLRHASSSRVKCLFEFRVRLRIKPYGVRHSTYTVIVCSSYLLCSVWGLLPWICKWLFQTVSECYCTISFCREIEGETKSFSRSHMRWLVSKLIQTHYRPILKLTELNRVAHVLKCF